MTAERAPLDFATWSDLSARSTHGSRDAFFDLLDAEKISIDDYEASERIHLDAMVAALARGDRTLAEEHGRRCAASRPGPAVADDATSTEDGAGSSGRPLPFGEGRSREFETWLAESRARGAVEQSGETLLGPAPSASSTLPFDASASIPTVDQYARLCAELAHTPDRRADVLARHRLDERKMASLERLFKKRLELDAVLASRFLRAMSEVLKELRRE